MKVSVLQENLAHGLSVVSDDKLKSDLLASGKEDLANEIA